MPYATQADIEAFSSTDDLVDLTDRGTPATGAVDTVVLDAALANASKIMDGYFARRYATPLASASADVTIRCVQIAYYLLHRDSAPEKVRRDYDDALKWLRDVSDGRVVLDGDLAAAPEGAGDAAEIDAPDRVFTNSTMGGF